MRLYDEVNEDDFDSDDWAEVLGIRKIDELRDQSDEETERGGRYAKDWEYVSHQYRSEQNFVCENCGVDLSRRKFLLHTHHVDQNKANNNFSNLKALCVLCHAGHHSHLLNDVSAEDKAHILNLRQPWKSAGKT